MELKVGATVLIAIAILVLGIIWGKNYSFGTDHRNVSFLFDNSGGLRTKDEVTVNGVRKGHVAGIQLEGDKVRVEVALSPEVELYSDYRAYITAAELMGGQKLEIKPGSSGAKLDLEDPAAPLQGTDTSGFAEMMMGISQLASQTSHLALRLDTTLTMVQKLVDPATVQQPLVQTMQDLQATSRQLRELIASNDQLVRQTIANLSQTSSQVREIVTNRRDTLDSTLVSFQRSAERLEVFSSTLQEIAVSIENRQNTLGQLIHDDELFDKMRSAVNNVDSAATELRTNIGAFLSSSNFSFINLLSF